MLRHLDNLPEAQGQKPEFTLADVKDGEGTFSEVRFLHAELSMKKLTDFIA